MTIQQRRALLIGLTGPAIQVVGFIWQGAHMLIAHLHDPVDPRHLFFEGGVLLMGVGLLVTLICVPVAIEIARASEAELEVHVFERSDDAVPALAPQGQTASASE